MSTMTERDIRHVIESLRSGLVPERGIDAFAVGVDKERGELQRQLDLAASGEGAIKFLRGGYGCGKTFMARLALLDAQARGFATSFVVVSDNDLRFHRFDDVYRKVVGELATASCPRGALGDILDRWIGGIEAGMIAAGADEDADDFDQQVRKRIDDDLMSLTGGQVPADFVRVVQTVFDLKQRGEVAEAGALISWLSGSGNVSAGAKKRAGIKGDIGSRDALDYLRGVLAIVKKAGYKGLVIVIDEAETILRMRKDSRHKSLNGIRQIADAAGSYHGLLWMFTGTPEFFDERRGVAGLAPLHERVRFIKQGGFASRRQPQLELHPFDSQRLSAVALLLRGLYLRVAEEPARVDERVTEAFIGRMVEEVTKGFRGDVGVVPRQFLREFVSQMDRVDEFEECDPMRDWNFQTDALRPEEERAMRGAGARLPTVEGEEGDEEDDGVVPVEQLW
ncbi:BREX system ATP-binding protein BrxD [Haliangium ochraceum]|uniref:Putative ATP/GTP binding protein n=1 Tax=Haliangium ochraceum (strain DSM 14365 / JCM 11303 / SMP-2) TaxID=502025 RepID=D0LLM3_HALO1|nr:BREX system ATP-binding protein BrxD [Haliangium ochraceum]ACY13240.1 putative ATP/GTP binding protein [Haliangium ochraceum DSM 14365]